MAIRAIPAFSDNYLWLVVHGSRAAVIDPGDAQPVLDTLQRLELQLELILLTHHHADHIGGVQTLQQQTGAMVAGPAFEPRLPKLDRALEDTERLDWPNLDLNLELIAVPGHTLGHAAWFGRAAGQEPVLFCGDTLFSAGCGRVFEGTAEQMTESLAKLAALPGHTQVYPTHEYTLANLRWARTVDPSNHALLLREEQALAQRAQGQATLPVALKAERQYNPFLRLEDPDLIAAASTYVGHTLSEPAEVFAALRHWKNEF